MSLQSMTTLSSLLSRRKGGTMTVEFAFRHWYTRTCTRSFSTIWKVLRNSFDSREEIKKARNWANGDNDWRVVGNSSISASASSRRQAKSRRIFTAINFPKEDKRGLDAERCIIDARYSPNGAKVVVYLAITVKYLRLRRQVSWPIAADHFRPVKSSPLRPLRSPLLLYHHRPNRHR